MLKISIRYRRKEFKLGNKIFSYKKVVRILVSSLCLAFLTTSKFRESSTNILNLSSTKKNCFENSPE